MRARALRGASREVQTGMIEEMRTASERALETFRRYAPVGATSTLHDSLEVRFDSGRANPRFTIEGGGASLEDQAGVDYLPITRFGHRVEYITPVNGRALSIPGADPDTGETDHRGGHVRSRVPGYDPVVDWASFAADASERYTDLAAARLERRVRTRLLR